jgi:tetratricopeptide (TPR) repeat protein
MRFRVLAVAVLAAWLPGASAQSPTAAEQLAKAVFAQQSSGDLDAAIQVYRQIIASNPTQRNIATQAQFRLFQALLQKGDLNAAQVEFQNLVLNYADNRDLIASMAGRLNGGGSHGMSVSLGKLENGRYHHNLTGIEFNVPSGWKLEGDTQSSDNGEIVILSQQNSMRSLAVWLKPDPTPPGNIAARLQHDVERKHEDREPGWTVRTSSIQMRSVGGQQALTAIADFTEGKKPAVEYMTWVRSTKSRCFFFGSGPAEDLASIQGAIEQMLASAMVP